uniref:Uncharacterized protein n=1 Tax=Anguilla anguilla TaxID=7936 RepID=A0A0E9RYX0_ANGAN
MCDTLAFPLHDCLFSQICTTDINRQCFLHYVKPGVPYFSMAGNILT